MLPWNSWVTLVGLIIAIFGVVFMLGGNPVIGVMLLLVAWVLVMLDGPLEF
jgi:phosphatidylserine synthase